MSRVLIQTHELSVEQQLRYTTVKVYISCIKIVSARYNIGGIVQKNSWKWFAHMRTPDGTCGAAILSDQWVVTAGHCCLNLKASEITIHTNDYDYDDIDENEHIVKVKKIHIHHAYVDQPLQNDICLLEMESSLTLKAPASVVCPPSTRTKLEDIKTLDCYVAGFGVTDYDDYTSPEYLQSIKVNVFTHQECNSFGNHSPPHNSNQEFCAGYMEGGKDSCQGDSGGPLICLVRTTPILFGLVSWGDKCAEPRLPGVYTWVPAYIEWIDLVRAGKLSEGIFTISAFLTCHFLAYCK